MIEETFQILREEKESFKKRFFKAANNATIVLRIFVILGKFDVCTGAPKLLLRR